ncbi:hypothetical protein NXT08_22550 [Rhodococcus pyridinivorans]|uniref:hypothetical protein n=1 Tax=Rhodococcus pyridinivorans TaxID=103816 RepID=UPI002164C262|nr:hypothetical protein [Rhodococcus pyridinivorans]UVT24985.1 hypothetical protein NXT08_22550 [Rhodococcus pyridinivorans]
MKNIATNWPVIRQAVYGLLTLVGAIAVGAGLLTESQSAQYLGYAALALTTLGNVLAALFVERTSPAQEQKIEQAVEVGFERAAQRAQPHVQGAVDRVNDLRERYVDPFIRR